MKTTELRDRVIDEMIEWDLGRKDLYGAADAILHHVQEFESGRGLNTRIINSTSYKHTHQPAALPMAPATPKPPAIVPDTTILVPSIVP